MARKSKKRSVFDYEGSISPSGSVTPPTDTDLFELTKKEEVKNEEPEHDEGWIQSIIDEGPPPTPDTAFPEFDEEQEHRLEVKRRRFREPKEKSEVQKKLDKALEGYKTKPTLVHNEILGMVRQEVLDEAISRGAILRITKGNVVYYAIPYTEDLIGADKTGKPLANPIKVKTISDKYYKFREELENGTLKISPSNRLL